MFLFDTFWGSLGTSIYCQATFQTIFTILMTMFKISVSYSWVAVLLPLLLLLM